MNGQAGRRIHITGGPGSGKTTLARQVAARLHTPCYDLDEVGFEGGAGAKRPLELRLADIRRIAAQPAWVTEGIFLGWTVELFEAADRIVWLDLPWRLVGWRIFMRHVKAELRGNNRHSGWLKLYRFLQWCRIYYDRSSNPLEVAPGSELSENRATTEQVLTAFSDKLLRCVSPAEVMTYLESL